jgi:hypothetical protein
MHDVQRRFNTLGYFSLDNANPGVFIGAVVPGFIYKTSQFVRVKLMSRL